MQESEFIEAMHVAIMDWLRGFMVENPGERPYGFALIGGQDRDYAAYAIATEQRLKQVAQKYDEMGYRYRAPSWQQFDNPEMLAIWLRWANPDDGWFIAMFPRPDLNESLREMIDEPTEDSEDDPVERFTTENVLTQLWHCPAWRDDPAFSRITVGFTYGGNHWEFVRSATRANPYLLVAKLWHDRGWSNELDHRIESPHKRDRDSKHDA